MHTHGNFNTWRYEKVINACIYIWKLILEVSVAFMKQLRIAIMIYIVWR